MMRIAIIGGSGFIGTRLARRLIASGHAVAIIDKSPSRAFPERVRIADVRDPAALERALEGCEAIYNLAAEHRDDVTPRSLYDDVNVGGARNVCAAAAKLGISKIAFTSSVAVYGFAAPDTDETGRFGPFNDYGRTKMEAEAVLREWLAGDGARSLFIVRPTVVFGERNRGNVYNLLKQMASGRFVMVGSGRNEKSMAYVENVAACLERALECGPGERLYNYVDKPDYDMNSLVALVRESLGKDPAASLRLPYWLGYLGGVCFDLLAFLTRRKFAISAIRVRKFCSTTKFSAEKLKHDGFQAPVAIREGLMRTIRFEFLEDSYREDDQIFQSE